MTEASRIYLCQDDVRVRINNSNNVTGYLRKQTDLVKQEGRVVDYVPPASIALKKLLPLVDTSGLAR